MNYKLAGLCVLGGLMLTGCDEQSIQKKQSNKTSALSEVELNTVGTVIDIKMLTHKHTSEVVYFIDTDGNKNDAEYAGHKMRYTDGEKIKLFGQAYNAKQCSEQKTIAQWKKELCCFCSIDKQRD